MRKHVRKCKSPTWDASGGSLGPRLVGGVSTLKCTVQWLAASRQRGEDDSWKLVACIALHEPPGERRRGEEGKGKGMMLAPAWAPGLSPEGS